MYLLEKGTARPGQVHVRECQGCILLGEGEEAARAIEKAGTVNEAEAEASSYLWIERGWLKIPDVQALTRNVTKANMSLREAEAYVLASVSLGHVISLIAWERHTTILADPDARELVADWLRRRGDTGAAWDLLEYVDAERFVDTVIAPEDRAEYVYGETGVYLVIFDE